MSKLPKLELKEIVLPGTDIHCFIAISYGDVCDIEEAVNTSLDFEISKDPDAKQKMNGLMISKEKEALILKGLKSWDLQEDDGSPMAITTANIKRLPREAGDFLYSEIRGLYEVKTSDEVKKK